MNETSLIAEVRALTGITASQVPDSDMALLIGMALDEYSYYNPNVNFTADAGYLVTVSDQPDYSFPTGALWIIEVFWTPDSEYWEDQELRLYQDFILGFKASHPVDLSIYYHQVAALRRYFSGTWKTINGKIWLIPPPTENDNKVALLYATAKTLASMAEVKDFLFKRLVAAYVWQRRAFDLLQNTGWRAGAYSVSQSVGQATAKKAEDELTTARALLANAYGAITDYTHTKPFGIQT